MTYSLIKRALSIWIFRLFYKKQFKCFGKNVSIVCPLKINGINNISIENNVTIEYKTWLAAVPIEKGTVPVLRIGEGSAIGHFNHIYSTKSIIIGKKVLTADKVYISDNLHGYDDITVPVIDQPVRQIGEVEIGDGTWIGENVCVIGANIGKNCVIGANSVVTKDIPDYCVAVGVPCRILKRFNHETKKWERLN
ncbi:MAG: acyltransferase [Bacteroidales bacterium]|nr:acyltransferase [Bacteroidales bacterium]